ncbi:MAG: hypothetical protein HY866_23500 [Chloroflexi bacterium]|nr:hypothetical protein [Chloroflexota bacterium]
MIACLRLPYFTAALEQREHSHLQKAPLALLDSTGQGARVVGLSAEAAQTGIQVGMSVRAAEALCTGLHLLPETPARYRRVFEELLDGLTLFTARVEPEDGPELRADGLRRVSVPFVPPSQMDRQAAATCYLDLGKLSPDEALDTGHQLGQFVQEQTQLPVTVGLAGGKFPARVAAVSLHPGELLIVPNGQAAEFLAGFSAALLPVDGETLRQLDLLGLRTLGDVAVQPVAALVDRFGKPGRILHPLANGHDTSPVLPYTPRVVEQVVHQTNGPINDRQVLAAIIQTQVEQSASRLHTVGCAARSMVVALTLENGTRLERAVMLRQPSDSLRHLVDTAEDLMAAFSISQGVTEIELVLGDLERVTARQLGLFERQPVSQEQLSEALRHLVARYGDGIFYRVRLTDPDARLPERRFRLEKAGEP